CVGRLLPGGLLSRLAALARTLPPYPSSSADADNSSKAGPSRYIERGCSHPRESNCRPPEGAIATKFGLQFAPGITRGEGQYVAVMRKTAAAKPGKQGKPAKNAKVVKCDWVGDEVVCCEVQTSAGPLIKACPANLQADIHAIEASLRAIRSGVAVAAVKGRDLIPQADLALSRAFNRSAFPQIELSKEQALSFLRCEALQLPDAPRGFIAVTYEQLPIGFVKNLGSRANNLFPQTWRLRMS
ncbi:MAG: hypothetical protein J5693_05910, partial [Bacteroidales bacterium]|nr:hypothetical protein [Bacteroidales bacterium]